MNLTYNGLRRLEEAIVLCTDDSDTVARAPACLRRSMGPAVTIQLAASDSYSHPNEVDPLPLEKQATQELLRVPASRLQMSAVRTLLPARVGGTTRWYGLAPSDCKRGSSEKRFAAGCDHRSPRRTVNVQNSSDQLDQEALRLVPTGSMVLAWTSPMVGKQTVPQQRCLSHGHLGSRPRLKHGPTEQAGPGASCASSTKAFYIAADRVLAEIAWMRSGHVHLLNSKKTTFEFLRVELLAEWAVPRRSLTTPRWTSAFPCLPQAGDASDSCRGRRVLFSSNRPSPAVTTDQLEAGRSGTRGCLARARNPAQQATPSATARVPRARELLAAEPRRAVLTDVATLFPDDPVIAVAIPAPDTRGRTSTRATALSLYHAGDYWAALRAAKSNPSDDRRR